MFNSTKPVLITLNIIPYLPWKGEHIVKIIKEKLIFQKYKGTLQIFLNLFYTRENLSKLSHVISI